MWFNRLGVLQSYRLANNFMPGDFCKELVLTNNAQLLPKKTHTLSYNKFKINLIQEK